MSRSTSIIKKNTHSLNYNITWMIKLRSPQFTAHLHCVCIRVLRNVVFFSGNRKPNSLDRDDLTRSCTSRSPIRSQRRIPMPHAECATERVCVLYIYGCAFEKTALCEKMLFVYGIHSADLHFYTWCA